MHFVTIATFNLCRSCILLGGKCKIAKVTLAEIEHTLKGMNQTADTTDI